MSDELTILQGANIRDEATIMKTKFRDEPTILS